MFQNSQQLKMDFEYILSEVSELEQFKAVSCHDSGLKTQVKWL